MCFIHCVYSFVLSVIYYDLVSCLLLQSAITEYANKDLIGLDWTGLKWISFPLV